MHATDLIQYFITFSLLLFAFFFVVVAVGCSYFSTSNRASARLQKQHLFADALDEILYTRTMIVLTE